MAKRTRLPDERLHVTYQPVPEEQRAEALFARWTGRRSLDAAKQAMLRARRDFTYSVKALLQTGAMRRVTSWIRGLDHVLDQRPVPEPAAALVAKARIDGVEDGELAALGQQLHDPVQARSWLRTWYHERTAGDDLAASVCKLHGFKLWVWAFLLLALTGCGSVTAPVCHTIREIRDTATGALIGRIESCTGAPPCPPGHHCVPIRINP